MSYLHPDVISEALDLTTTTAEISTEARVNAWDRLKDAAISYINLVYGSEVRPVGRGVVGDPERTKMVWFCKTHGWAGDEGRCSYPEMYRKSLRWGTRSGKRRKARAECAMEPRLLVGLESFTVTEPEEGE